MADVHYHIERPGPRSRYILAHVLGGMTGWHAEEVQDRDSFASLQGPKLVYGHLPVEGALLVAPHGLLQERGILDGSPECAMGHGPPQLFPVQGGGMPFDVFSGAFFLLSRMEEYGPIRRDEHQRPVTAALHASRFGYLERPVVDEWLKQLIATWRQLEPRLPALRRNYSHTATMDADNGAMFLGRPWWRTLGSAARDLLQGRPDRVMDRVRVLSRAQADPYAVHRAFLDLAAANGAQANIHFIAAPRGKHDHAVPLRTRYMRDAVQLAAKHGALGLHPGYGSSDRAGRTAAEKALLEATAGSAVEKSRQHYLRMQLPGTMRELERLGIREEHSMGLADAVGFRAGTCTPYPFYDLAANEQTALMVHPFAVMDSALAYKLRLSPIEALTKALQLADAVRAVRGKFISVWHERFFSDYGDEAGWGMLAPAVLAHAKP